MKKKSKIISLTRADVLNFVMKTKFADKIDCWEFLGRRHTRGYRDLLIGGKKYYAHRVSYQLFVGDLKENLEIDHLCRNRVCVNPYHLEQVTSKVNTLRGNSIEAKNARKTHCKRGHEFSRENTFTQRNQRGRRCRTCARGAWKRYKRRMRKSAPL